MRSFALLLFTIFLMFGCVIDQGKVAVDIKRKTSTANASTLSATVSNVQIINNQMVITGVGLNTVTNVKVDGNSLNQNFTIESQTATQIIANAVSAFSFDVSKVFNLILSDANAAATFPIDFSICNATLNGHGFNCAVPAIDKDVLSYDSVSGKWKPRSINGLNYQGTWDAATAEPSGASPGDYYIVSAASAPYGIGDWIVWNGAAYDKISNSTTITAVFGRSGAIVATEGDYNLDKLFDVDLTVPPTVGKVLKFDGMKWVAGDDNSGGGAGSVTSSEIANGAVTDAKIDTVSASKITGTITSAQIADGSIVNADVSATAAIDYSKLNIPAGSIPYAKLNIANGDIPAAKISGLPAATAVLATTISDNDTTHAPDGNAVFDALATKLNTTGGTLTIGTISGVPNPTNNDDVANKAYVDSAISGYVSFTEAEVLTTDLLGLNTGVNGPIVAADTVLGAMGKLQYQVTDLKGNGQWIKTGNDIAYSAGNVTVDKSFILKDTGTNHIEIKAPATVTTNYVLTLPPNDGNTDQVLRTDGNGVLTWVNVTDTSVQTFAKTTLPTCGAGEVLKSNGTVLTCVTDASGGGAFTGSNSRAVATDGSGALTSSSTTATELGYVSGVTSSIQTQLDAKQATITAGTSAQYYRGDKTFVTLDTAVVPENTNLYFTAARAKSATVADAIVDAVLDVAPSQNAVHDALALKLNLTGGTLSVGTINGVPNPTNNDDVANKAYVDTKIAKTALPTCGAGEVLKSDGTNITCVTDNSGGGAFSGTASRAVQTGTGGALEVSAVTTTELGYVSGVTSAIQTQLNAKQGTIAATTSADYYRGDKTFATLNTTAVPEGTALYFTEPRVLAAVLTSLNTGVNGPITATDSVLGAFGKLQYQITDLKTFDTSVQTFAKTTLPTCGAGEVLKSNGTALSCVTDASGAGAFSGTANRAIASDGSGALTSSATTATELGYVSGVTSSIQTQLNAKEGSVTAGTSAQYYRGDKTFVTLDTSVVPENTNLYFTTARAKSATVADSITDAITDVAPSQNAVFDALALKLNKTGGTLSVGTISGVPTPTNNDDVANKGYVDTKFGTVGAWSKNVNNVDIYYNTGKVGIGTDSPTSKLTLVSDSPASAGDDDVVNASFANGQAPFFVSARARGSIASPLPVQDTDWLGGFSAIGWNGSGWGYGSSIKITADSDFSSAVNSGIQFTSVNAGSEVDSMKIAPSGKVGIGNSDPKTKLDVTGAIRMGADSALGCSGTTAGALRYESSNVEFCNGTAWKPFSYDVQAFAKSVLPTCSAGQVLKSNGTAFSCVADSTGAAAFSGTINRAVATDGSGALAVSTTTATELGYVSGVTSSIQTQLNAKEGSITAGTSAQYFRGDKTFVTLDTAAVPENTNLYFTTARAKAATVADSITDAITDVAPSQNAVFDALALKLNKTGGTMSVGTISGVPTPTNADDVANKGYVDGYGQWTKGTGPNAGDVYRATGLVGIGTSTPASPLQLGEVFSLQQDINSGYIGANFGYNTTGKYLKSQYANQIHFDSATGIIAFKVAPSGTAGNNITYSTPMRIYPSGDIGMGVSSPIGSLHVARTNASGWGSSFVLQSSGAFAGTAGSGHLQAYRTRGTEAAPTAVQSGDYLGALDFVGYGTSAVIGSSIESMATETWSGSASGSSMIFKTSANTTFNSPVERMRIDQNGRISLGVITPEVQLHATGAASFSKIFTTGNNAASTSDPYAADLIIGSYAHANSTRHDSSIMMWSAGSASRIYQNADNFYFSQWSQDPMTGANVILSSGPGGGSTFRGGVSAVSFTTTSDRRLKKNIETIDDALEKVLGLRGVEFDWRRDGKHEVGLIAQEVEKVEPNLVMTHEDGFKGVKYSNIVALLIEAMKTEHKKVEANLAMMKTMQSTIADHGRRIASIETELEAQKKTNEKLQSENKMMKAYLCSKDKKAPFCR